MHRRYFGLVVHLQRNQQSFTTISSAYEGYTGGARSCNGLDNAPLSRPGGSRVVFVGGWFLILHDILDPAYYM